MSLKWSFRLRKTFFARQSGDELDRAYFGILEQQFQLKQYGNLSLFEQETLIAEDRAWWMRRLEKEAKEKQEAQNKNQR